MLKGESINEEIWSKAHLLISHIILSIPLLCVETAALNSDKVISLSRFLSYKLTPLSSCCSCWWCCCRCCCCSWLCCCRCCRCCCYYCCCWSWWCCWWWWWWWCFCCCCWWWYCCRCCWYCCSCCLSFTFVLYSDWKWLFVMTKVALYIGSVSFSRKVKASIC